MKNQQINLKIIKEGKKIIDSNTIDQHVKTGSHKEEPASSKYNMSAKFD